MIRPPKPVSKPTKIVCISGTFHIYGQNINSSSYFQTKIIKPLTSNAHKSTSKIIPPRNTKTNTKLREDTSTDKYESNQYIQTQQNIQQIFNKLQNNFNQHLIPQPNQFKIRQLSSHSKRSKQNRHPNQNKSVQMQCHSSNSYFHKQPIQYKTDQFITNHQQSKMHLIANKTKILPVQPKQNQSFLCFILSQSLFEEPITSQTTLTKLKMICQIISNKNLGIIILKMSNNINISQKLSIITQKTPKLDYILYSSDKYTSTISIFNISTLSTKHHLTNIIIIDTIQTGQINLYTTSIINTKYLYYFINGYNNLLQFVKTINIKVNCNFYHQEYLLIYLSSMEIYNNTQKILNNQLIKQQIKIAQNHPQNIPKPKHSQLKKDKPQDPLQLNPIPCQFQQNYKNKLIQFIKLLQIQQKNKNSILNILNYKYPIINHYIKINQIQSINTLMQCHISTNTAYQIASELIKNNSFNSKQINQFREKCQIFKP